MKSKTWNSWVLGSTLAILVIIAAITILIDPFLHYHKPLSFLEYPLKDERYINDGISRNYEYQAMITGTSMCQNFKTSEFEELWKVPAIKIAYSGASYHELNANIERALSYNPDLKYILCSLDGTKLNSPSDFDEYSGYPDYLYDRNPFNDVSYLLNKDVVPKTVAVLNYTRAGEKTPTFDMYGSWSQYKSFGKETVQSSYTRLNPKEEELVLSEEDIAQIKENIEKNYLATAKENEEVEFYFFFPPYSICYWDALYRTKQLGAQLRAQELAVELLLSADNVHVFAFDDCVEITGDLDNYTDTLHYGDWINSYIIQNIYEGNGELKKDNYQTYFEQIEMIYSKYDYSVLD